MEIIRHQVTLFLESKSHPGDAIKATVDAIHQAREQANKKLDPVKMHFTYPMRHKYLGLVHTSAEPDYANTSKLTMSHQLMDTERVIPDTFPMKYKIKSHSKAKKVNVVAKTGLFDFSKVKHSVAYDAKPEDMNDFKNRLTAKLTDRGYNVFNRYLIPDLKMENNK